jgi:hypothetical protein
MAFCIVLLEGKLKKLAENIVDDWDNNTGIRALIYCDAPPRQGITQGRPVI